MTPQEVKNKFQKLTVWKRGGQRAPHKPLLALYAIGRLQRGESRFIRYETVDKDLDKLLREFGPKRKSYHPEYPFWRLQNDGVWELDNIVGVSLRKGNTDAKKSELLKIGASGGFTSEVQAVLAADDELLEDIVRFLLQQNFPDTFHEDILAAVGVDLGDANKMQQKRDPEFRSRILRAYEYRCAICGFDVRIGDRLVGVEAGHIKWHQAGGPDEEINGLALCTMHHTLFDRGAFTLTDSMRMIVSEDAHGSQGFKDWLMAFHGKLLRPPVRENYYPAYEFVKWHVREVFQGPGRYAKAEQ